jgi:tyrosyl-tRNA synthetase
VNKALEALQRRGFVSQCTDIDGLSAALDAGPLTFYVGCDPTGSSLHIGHMVPFFAFRHLRAAGCRGVALIGGGTARIGDPSGKSEMRPILDYQRLDNNADAISAQLGRFLGGFDNNTALCLNNKTWLADLNYIDFLRNIGRHFSVNRMLSFEAYKRRLETGLSFIEFNYQLLQSYDFLQLYQREGCRLQIGGDDQWGNITAGMELIRRVEGDSASVFGLTFPLVTTADGKKMGKTEKGAIFLDSTLTTPYDFYQYWRNIPDADIHRFLLLFTFLPIEECDALTATGANPNAAKERLAWEVTALIHGADAADKARAGAQAAFAGAGDESAMPTASLSASTLGAGMSVVDLFVASGLCRTKSEARRLVAQGGAAMRLVTGELAACSDGAQVVTADDFASTGSVVLRAGKKRYCRITLS